MFGLDDIIGGIGDVAGYFAGGSDRESARNDLIRARQNWEDINPTINAQETGPSAFNNAGTDSRAAQMDILAQLRNKYSQGGLDALDRGRLAEINASTAQAGRAAGEAAKQDAARRGMLNSGNALVSQQVAGQGAAQVGSRAGVDAAAQAEAARRGALNQAGYIAGETRGQDYHRAAAQDAIQQFNARQRQGAQEATVGNQFRRAGGLQGSSEATAGAKYGDAARTQGLYGGIGRMAGSAANFFVNPAAGAAGGGDAAGGDYLGGASYFSDGGTVPGPDVNADVIDIKATPGEVVLPRAMVEWFKKLLTTSPQPQTPPPQSSPSVFDAKAAMDAHKRELEQALEGAR
jgi:hypothetical protein